ncbi:MAG: ABC transporter permease [Eubacteriales bacterium]|nr:ABC transporter permease [Eubacteriales bacterium]
MTGGSRWKTGALGAVLYTAALLFLAFIRYRPNRILTGETYRLSDLIPFGGLPTLVLPVILAGAFLFLLARGSTLRALASVFAACAPLFILGWGSALPAFSDETARISIGAGFWAAMAASLMMLWDSAEGKKAGCLYLAPLIVAAALLILGRFDTLSLLREYASRQEVFFAQSGRHLALAATSTAAAAAAGIPLTFLLFSRKKFKRPVFFLVNLAQTVPTLSLLGLLMAPLAWLGANSAVLKGWGVSGVGFWPAWIALFLYAIFPVLNNTFAGLSMADPAVVEAASSLGMTGRQVFLKVQLPLAVPLILGGIRTAFTQGMGNAILAALIGGGGLGSFIFLGLAQSAPDLILLGTLPLITLTLLMDALLEGAVKLAERGKRHDSG